MAAVRGDVFWRQRCRPYQGEEAGWYNNHRKENKLLIFNRISDSLS
jgi:hypothetical protein